MLKTIPASTIEIDEPNEAVAEILDQIDFEALLDNSVGIVSCNLEYITNGSVEKLAEKLPFDILGSTTTISDICGEADENQLSLMVLTSDTLSFATGVSDALNDNNEEKISKTYDATVDRLKKKPSLGIFFAPFILDVSADDQLHSLDKVSDSIPLFGTVALDYVENVRDPRTIYNGKDYSDNMALLLIAGELNPLFFVESISEELFLKQKAIVTASQGNLLQEVNSIPAIEYLESLGLVKNGVLDNIPLVPLSVDVGDGGLPSARAIFAVTPDGAVICGGDMPKDATLGVGSFDAEDVKTTATHLAEKIKSSGSGRCALIFSCMGRNRALGLDPMHEIERIQAVLGTSIPYLFMYSGGEIYPDYVDGKPLNKALNDSIIGCVL